MATTDHSNPSRLAGWLEGKRSGRIITYAVIPILVIVALLLPPVSLVQRATGMGATRITEAGALLSDPDGTQVQFLPGTVKGSFRAALASIPRVSFLEGSAGKDLLEAAKAIPPNLVVKSPFYSLTTRGDAKAETDWLIPIPNDSEPYETLDVYTWDSASQSWEWLPHSVMRESDQVESHVLGVPGSALVVQTNPMPAIVSADVAQANALSKEATGALAQVHPTGLYLGSGGNLDGAIDANFDRLGGSSAVVPVIRNYEGPVVRSDLLANMLVDVNQRGAHVNALTNLVVGNLYKGVDIDYRGLDPGLRDDFTQFVAALSQKLHAQGKTLGVRVPEPTQVSEDRWETGGYDLTAISALADSVKISAPVDPRAYTPGGAIEKLLDYSVSQANRYKVQMVLGGRSIEQSGNYLLQKSYSDALQPLIGRIKTDQTVVEPGKPLNLALVSTRPNSGLVYDPNIGAYVYRYQDDQGNARTVWLENAASLSHKLELLKRYNIQGFTVENLPADGLDPDLWSLMRSYQQGRSKPIESNFTVEWTIRNSGGEQLSQVSRPLGDPNVVLAAPMEAGDLLVEAAVVDRGLVLSKESADPIAVATFTPTPTPTPVFTPTPIASPTPNFSTLASTSGTINVRSGPGTNYPKIGEIAAGTTYRITGRNAAGDWWQFALGEQSGWVSSQLVATAGASTSVGEVAVAPPPTAQPQAASSAPASGPSYPAAGGYFGYGVQAQVYGGADLGSVAGQTKGLGFNWVKFQLPWKDFEGSKGAYGWGGMDSIVDSLGGAGLNILASIVKAPNWSRPPNTDLSVEGPAANAQDYADFVGAFAARYKGRVKAVEVWNEQNLWYEWGHEPLDPGRYVDMLCRAYRAIKAGDSNMVVVAGALTPTGVNDGSIAIDDVTYLQRMYAAGAKNCSDAIGAHPSGYNNPPDAKFGYSDPSHPSFKNHPSFFFRDTMERYRGVMAANGDTNKRIWPTEFGWASTSSPLPGYEYARDINLDQQAAYLVQAYQMGKSWGWVGPMFLWNLNFGVTNPGTELAAFGIQGKPAYGALAGMPK